MTTVTTTIDPIGRRVEFVYPITESELNTLLNGGKGERKRLVIHIREKTKFNTKIEGTK